MVHLMLIIFINQQHSEKLLTFRSFLRYLVYSTVLSQYFPQMHEWHFAKWKRKTQINVMAPANIPIIAISYQY